MTERNRLIGAGLLTFAAITAAACGEDSNVPPTSKPTIENPNAVITDLGNVGDDYHAYQIITKDGQNCVTIVNSNPYRDFAAGISCSIR